MDDKFNPFMWCKVNKVVINDNAIMPPYVFYGCGVDTLVLGENVTFVDADDCPPFTGELAVSFLEHVETLPIRAFYNWTCLYDVSLPPKMSHISDSVFYGAINLTELKLSKGIKSIGKYAFSGCQSLKTISIPAWATISSYAFQHCANLETITIPDRISNYAFAGCQSLKEIYINNPLVTPIDEDVFTTTVYNYATLYVPEGTTDLYNRIMGWRNFFFIKEWDAPDYIEENVKEIPSLQIEANEGVLIIQSISNGIPVSVYNVEGVQIGYAVAADGNVVMSTNMKKGDVAIVKIGKQTKRVIMK